MMGISKQNVLGTGNKKREVWIQGVPAASFSFFHYYYYMGPGYLLRTPYSSRKRGAGKVPEEHVPMKRSNPPKKIKEYNRVI